MRKKILLVLVLCLLLVGCSEEKIKDRTLVCKKSYNISDNQVDERISSLYTEDKLVSTDIEIKMLVAEKYLNHRDILKNNLLNNYIEYQNVNGVTFNLIDGENYITIVININYESLDENSASTLGFGNDQSSYKDAESTLTNNEYVCS